MAKKKVSNNMTGWIGKAKVTKDYVDRLGYRRITIDGKEHVFTWNAQPNSRAAEQKMHPTLLESAPLEALSTPEHSATSQTDQTPQQRG